MARKSSGSPRFDDTHTVVEAVNLALARALDDDPQVVVFGEDVGVNGGVFRATLDLQTRSVQPACSIRHWPRH